MGKNNMKKLDLDSPDLTKEEKDTLKSLAKTSSANINVVKKIIVHYMEEVNDISNIDPERSMGFQAKSFQLAYEALRNIFDDMFNNYEGLAEDKKKRDEDEYGPYQ